MVEVSIGKSCYKIPCENSQKERLLELASKLNTRVNSLSFKIRSTDETMILVMAALMLEEELEKNEARETSSIKEQDIYDAVSDNMENIANHIEKLTAKIQNY